MAKQKRDYSRLKLEFFESDYDSVNEFFIQKYNQNTANNKQIATNTKWRWKQKQERKEKIMQKALEKSAEKKAKELEIDVELLQKWKKNWLIQIINKLSKKWNLPIGDIVKWLNAIKTELWEPTSIWKTDAVIKDETTDQNPLKEKLLKLKQNNQWNISSWQKKK